MNTDQLDSGRRTVVQLAEYFRELKATASDLAERVSPQQRGYFTTTEEEQTRGLQISYWQSRCALLDLITSLRREVETSEEDRPEAFLIAFAAAVVLVDAARFLRETVENRPLVREKLNEAAPDFGIPAGMYDTVQRSLVSARHAWHLYHAIQYFRRNDQRLRRLAAATQLAPLCEVIDQLQHRLDISVARFAEVKLRTRGDQVLRRLSSNLFGRAMYGLQKLAGNLLADKYVRSGHQPALPGDVATRIRALLAPGDVLIVRKEYALTNYFLPGYWPHAALYLGESRSLEELGIHVHEHVKPRWARLLGGDQAEPRRVLESMKDGVHIRSLQSPFCSDSMVVLRPQLSHQHVAEGLARCLAHEGKAYDFDFDFRRADRLVCTEVVYRAYDGIGSIQLPLIRRAGRPTLSGGDLIRMGLRRAHFDPVLVYAPRMAEYLVTGSEVDRLLLAGEGNDENT